MRYGEGDGTGRKIDLVKPVGAAADVPADQVAVAALQLGRAEDVTGEDQVTKPGRVALDLRLDALHVTVELRGPVDPCVGPVRVRPCGVLAGGRPRRVGDASAGPAAGTAAQAGRA